MFKQSHLVGRAIINSKIEHRLQLRMITRNTWENSHVFLVMQPVSDLTMINYLVIDYFYTQRGTRVSIQYSAFSLASGYPVLDESHMLRVTV
jgi:hypothetical protein